jgi:hypothetical protein
MRKCLVHIGTHKTGTTSLQMLLHQHAAALAESNYLYPATGRSTSLFAHHNIAWQINSDARFEREAGTLEELVREIAATKHNVVISSEDLFTCLMQDTLKYLIDEILKCEVEVTIVVYLRNQIDIVRSAYLEHLRQGADLTFAGYLDGVLDAKVSLADLLERASGTGPVKLIVRSFDESIKTSFIDDFLALLGITKADIGATSEPRLNTSVSIPEGFLLFCQNRFRRAVTVDEKRVIDALFTYLRADNIGFSPSIKQRIRERFRDENDILHQRYGLPPFAAMQDAAEADLTPPDHVPLELVFSRNVVNLVHHLAKSFGDEREAVTGELRGVAEALGSDNRALREVAAALEADNQQLRRAAEDSQIDNRHLRGVAEAFVEDNRLIRDVAGQFHRDNQQLRGVAETLERDNKKLRGVAEALERDNKKLRGVAETLQRDNKELRGVAETLQRDNKELRSVAEAAQSDNTKLRAVVAALQRAGQQQPGATEAVRTDADQQRDVAETELATAGAAI